MLAGEPGIGKTRMAEELAANADVLGGQVLWGRCHEGPGRPPIGLGSNSSVLTFAKVTKMSSALKWAPAPQSVLKLSLKLARKFRVCRYHLAWSRSKRDFGCSTQSPPS